MKRFTYFLLTLTLCMFLMPLSTKAAGATWETKAYDDWTLKDETTGTDIEIKFNKDTHELYVRGTGAIASFPKDSLGNRPWYGKPVYKLFIEAGITSIGADAFSHYPYLTDVQLPASVFIEDPSAFGVLHEGCRFYFYGTNIVSRNIGNFPYTSLDSQVAFIQKYEKDYTFTYDNLYMIGYLNSGLTQKLQHVSPADALTPYTNPDYPLINYNAVIYAPNTVGIQYQKQGKAANEAFSIMLDNNHYAGTYNVFPLSGNPNLNNNYALSPAQVCIKIPNYFLYPGRTFGMVQILPGGIINVLQDEDASDETITFTTSAPAATYMLYYTN